MRRRGQRRRLAALAALTAILLAPLPAGAAGQPSAAERLAPVLVYDHAEDFFARAVPPGGGRGHSTAYVHRIRDDGSTWLQYWLFYAENTQDRGILATGRHEGDWEFVQIRLGPEGSPKAMTLAQHSVAERCSWAEIETGAAAGGVHPLVYVANGSHASYPRPGVVDRPWPDPNDEAHGDGLRVLPEVIPISASRPAWVADRRPWGNARAGWFPGEQSSPPGPRFQPDGRWRHPAAYESAARPCGAPPPGRPWQAPMSAGVVLLALAGVVLLVRRRRAEATTDARG